MARALMITRNRRGLSAIEVVVLLFILFILWSTGGAFHSGKFSQLIRLSDENLSRTNLGVIRNALAAYRNGPAGQNPGDLSALLAGGKYISSVPIVKLTPYHPAESADVRLGKIPNDKGGWLYNNIAGDATFGQIWINCTHTDSRGKAWTAY